MKFIFWHHAIHGPFSLQELYRGEVKFAGSVARLRLLFWIAERNHEVLLVGNVLDGEYRGLKAIQGENSVEFLAQSIQNETPTLFIISDPIDDRLWSMASSIRNKNIKIILWSGNSFDTVWMRRLSLNQLDRIVCISQFHKDIYRIYPGFERIETSYLGIDLDLLENAQKVSETRLVILFNSVPRKTKGFDNLLRAWKYIRAKYPQAVLKVCGSARMHEPNANLGISGIIDREVEVEFPELFVNYPSSLLESGIELLGELTRSEVYSNIKSADLVVLPLHKSIQETFCRCAVESQMAGVPVVGIRSGVLKEVVAEGETGLLTRSGNAQEIANKVLSILDDQRLRAKMSKNGPLWAIQFADYAKVSTDWEYIYNRTFKSEPVIDKTTNYKDFLRAFGYGKLRYWVKSRIKKFPSS